MKKKSLPERIFLHLKEGWLAALIVFAAALGANFERPMRLDDLYFDRMFTSFDGNILSFAQEYWMIWSAFWNSTFWLSMLLMASNSVNAYSSMINSNFFSG